MIEPELTPNGTARHRLPPGLIHDLRTPLNQIIGYSELMGEQARKGGQNDYVQDLERVRVAGRLLLEIMEKNLVADADSKQPTAPVSSREQSPAPSLVLEPGRNQTDGLLLVVDDDEGNRDVLARRLETQGYAVARAENGRQALEMLQADPVDLILLDIMMPEMDGYEVLRRLNADDRLRHIPVIMISALSELESVARCIEMGADDYLTKPFEPTVLRARVGASLEKKRSRDREIHLFNQLQESYSRLQDLERVRDDLTHMIVHDLRTPLTSVIAAMQTFDVIGDLNDSQREVLAISMAGADTLLGMVNSLLDVEKMESGAMELDYTLISLPELISSAIGQVAALSDAKDLKLIEDVSPDLPWLEGDENKLQRTLVNLLGNAIKFTPPGGSITLSAHPFTDTRSVEFCVRDTGEGIPQEAFQRIFEKFGQVETRASGRQMSTGLGLTFCKLAVEAHGGQIKVESVPGQGSTFCFSIPSSSTARSGEMRAVGDVSPEQS